MDIRDKLHLTQTKRYPVCHTNRDQSVAEHSYGVAMIALELADHWAEGAAAIDYEKLLVYALHHDVDEVFTGDIPSPFKRKLRTECPESIQVLDCSDHKTSDVVIKNIVKAADYIEAAYFLAEYGGSRRADAVMGDIQVKFSDHLVSCELGDAFASLARDVMNRVTCFRPEKFR